MMHEEILAITGITQTDAIQIGKRYKLGEFAERKQTYQQLPVRPKAEYNNIKSNYTDEE